ncbi:MAG: tRNA dihydrouridine synthase DusB [Proteobacteria bacterium]|nr:tRNA dihydrouridine synthase DusB [Pseudomonadota bacterium]
MEVNTETKLKIGELELGQGLILAPMAGITDLSFRRIAKSFDVDLVTSEMVSSEGLVRNKASTKMLLQSHAEEKPLAVQLFGSDPKVVAEAARIVADEGADIIDLNMGCPVPKVVRQGAGAALLRDAATVAILVDAVRQAVSIPVTVKTRSGWSQSKINVLEVARVAEDAGADAITIHPRTARQGFSGSADWSLIARVKQAVNIPVIGNGDVTRPEDVGKMRKLTQCDGVMIGRGAMGNPWIFEQARQLTKGQPLYSPTPQERLDVVRRHLELYEESLHGRQSLSGVRSRLMWYSKRLRGSARLRASLSDCRHLEDMIKFCEDFFSSLDKNIS